MCWKGDFVGKQLDTIRGTSSLLSPFNTASLFNAHVASPELAGITNWLNTEKSVSLADLRGKVVLVDFWTYTCINCIRTLPHVTSWYDKYKDNGFVVIGVHTPEFAFEKEAKNVQEAIARFHIQYPVAQDNDYATWSAFSNHYWPAEYLIDANGTIRRYHFGEGEYDEMEQAIQALLAEAGQTVTSTLTALPDQTPGNTARSPESYLGSARMEYAFPDGNIPLGTKTFTLPSSLPSNSFAFGGQWSIDSEKAIAKNNASLVYRFQASKVYLVLHPGQANGTLKISLDGNLIDQKVAGADVKDGFVTVDTDRLYTLVDLGNTVEVHTLTIEFLTPGTEAFAFTFG